MEEYIEDIAIVADDTEERVEGEEAALYRRPYTVRQRQEKMEFYDDEEFFQRFRLSKRTVAHVVTLIEDQIRPDSDQNAAISPTLQVLMALRYLATGTFHRVMGDLVGVERTTSGKKIRNVIAALASLRRRFVKMPETAAEISATKRQFYEIAGFPGVIGAIDCTHVPIVCPASTDAELYRNRKGFMSINVQAICDARYRVTNVVARWPGSTHDARIWDNSMVAARAEAGQLDGILVGDGGYRCTEYMMTPLAHPESPAERRYQKAQVRTRNPIERTFGMLKKFPCLFVGLRTNPTRCGNTIVAAAILYNIALSAGEIDPEEEDAREQDPAEPEPQPDGQQGRERAGQRNAARERLIRRHFQ